MNHKSPAIIILSQNSLSVARQILKALPEAKIYGLENRTQNVDIFFQNFSETLKELFSQGTPIIGICASGILIRTLAPLLSNKWQEPPLLAIAEDGSAVVPLLGGINGVNHLARCISTVLNITPAITTTGDIRFQTTLLSPPTGYHLLNPENAKTFISDLLAGNTLNLQGNAPWLTQSKLPISSNGNLTILITEQLITPPKNCLIYNPATIALGFFPTSEISTQSAINTIEQLFSQNNLSLKSLAAIFTLNIHVNHPVVTEICQTFNLPLRFFTPAEISNFDNQEITSSLALKAAGENSSLIVTSGDFALAIAEFPIDLNNTGHQPGHLAIIGTGPGSEKWMSPEVKDILKTSTDWIGYKTYLNLAEPFRTNQTRHESDNREELERAKHALNLAATGKKVAIISSGDPGIFAMASAVFEVLEREKNPQWDTLKIQVCPGISAMQAAAALAGAPLGHDFCAISLSDILKPWSIIEERIKAAASADFVIALYNPISKERRWQLAKAKEILLQYRSPQTPVVLAKNCGRVGQTVEIFTLQDFTPETADMRTIILIGSSQTRILPRPHEGVWVYTPRRYEK